jgi:hypothetical protein
MICTTGRKSAESQAARYEALVHVAGQLLELAQVLIFAPQGLDHPHALMFSL